MAKVGLQQNDCIHSRSQPLLFLRSGRCTLCCCGFLRTQWSWRCSKYNGQFCLAFYKTRSMLRSGHCRKPTASRSSFTFGILLICPQKTQGDVWMTMKAVEQTVIHTAPFQLFQAPCKINKTMPAAAELLGPVQQTVRWPTAGKYPRHIRIAATLIVSQEMRSSLLTTLRAGWHCRFQKNVHRQDTSGVWKCWLLRSRFACALGILTRRHAIWDTLSAKKNWEPCTLQSWPEQKLYKDLESWDCSNHGFEHFAV